jgi:hypothetical protein
VLELLLLGRKTSPDWFWDFRGGALPAGATFSRASTGWYINNAGSLVSASSDTARFAYGPVGATPHGLLIEQPTTNLYLRSNEFENAAWTSAAGTVVANQAVFADGTTTMDKYVENASANTARIIAQTVAQPTDVYIGNSVFVRAGTRTRAYVGIQGSAGHWVSAFFDLTTGTLVSTSVGTTSGTLGYSYIKDYGGGLFRIGVVGKISQANPFLAFGMLPNSGTSTDTWGAQSYNGDGVSFMHFGGAQAETSGMITSYVPTTTATVTRAKDVLSVPTSRVSGFGDGLSGGVWVATYRLYTVTLSGAGQNIFFVYNVGLANNYVDIRAQSGTQGGPNTTGVLVRTNGVFQVNISTTLARAAIDGRAKQASGVGPTLASEAIGGTLGQNVRGSYLMPIGDDAVLLGGSTGTDQLNGALESVAFYRGQRSGPFVQRVTQ